MTDRELLDLAAKAAGQDFVNLLSHGKWNPLTDDGDALRLAVKLRLDISPLDGGGVDVVQWRCGKERLRVSESIIDQGAATRRAIVRAAAAMSKESA